MANKNHIAIVLVVSAIIIVILAFIIDKQSGNSAELLLDENHSLDMIDGPLTPEEQLVSNPEPTNTMNPTAVITTNRGAIAIELFEDQMPITVGNFVSLAESDFYDTTKFHRVIDGFMIQGGDPNSKGDNEAIYGQGGPESNVQDEFVEGELLTNTRGNYCYGKHWTAKLRWQSMVH